MGSYVFSRLLQFVPTLFVVSVVVFLMVRAIPGDASYALLGPTAKPEQIAALRAEMGLDEPIWRQYLVWIEGVLRGDLGRSWINDFPVADLIRQKLPATIALAVGSMAIAVLIAIPMGILPALRPGSWIERVAALYNGLMLAIPTFWLGVLLVLVVSLRLGWLPPSGYVPFREDPLQSIKLLILPSFTLGAYLSAIFARFLHNAITETLSQDYVRTAAAKGLAERLVVRASRAAQRADPGRDDARHPVRRSARRRGHRRGDLRLAGVGPSSRDLHLEPRLRGGARDHPAGRERVPLRQSSDRSDLWPARPPHPDSGMTGEIHAMRRPSPTAMAMAPPVEHRARPRRGRMRSGWDGRGAIGRRRWRCSFSLPLA